MILKFTCATYEAAQEIGGLLVQGIQEELSGVRHGRWYPVPGNHFYDKNYYKSLPPTERAKFNYHVKYTGATNRAAIQGAAYQASAPGEPPAVRTGRLRQSFYMIINMLNEHTYEVSLRSNVFYADDLEAGTDHVDARPFIEPMLKKKMVQILAIQNKFHYNLLRGT